MKKKADHDKKVGYYPEMKPAEKAVRQQEKPAAKKWSKGVIVTLCACLAVFVVSTALLINYFSAINRSKQAAAQLKEIYSSEATASPEAKTVVLPQPTEASVTAETTEDEQPMLTNTPAAALALAFSDNWPSSYADNPTLRISSSFEKLRQQNKDIVGWLSIDGVLDEPVLQRDNDFYLTHDATGTENVTGALFLDENCNLRTVPNNTLIHGHNMKEGAMFGSLKKYKVKDAAFYKEHPYVTLNTLYEEGTYVIFAVTEINIRSDEHYYVPFWQYINFANESSFDAYIGKIREFSHFQTKVDVRPGDRLLTLATCSGSDENARLLISARMLRDGEDTIALKQGILSTSVK